MAESWASSLATRKSMQSNRSKDTKPELALRKQLHALGLRYRVCVRPIPRCGERLTSCSGQPMSLSKSAVASGTAALSTTERPAANSGYWSEKVQRNKRRDAENEQRLCDAGWLLVSVWEHEDPIEASERIAAIVRQRRKPTGRRLKRVPSACRL